MFTPALLQLTEKNKSQRASEGLRRIKKPMARELHDVGFVSQVAVGEPGTGPVTVQLRTAREARHSIGL